jgi:hypothetical protein
MEKERVRRDIEEAEEELDSREGDSLSFWARKQRELVTSVLDYNLGALSELVIGKAVNLSPGYQRRFRWDPKRQSRLIESFLMNVPVPPVFLNEDSYGTYSVIDGKQRLSAVTDFVSGKLRLEGLDVFSDLNGMAFDDLPLELQNHLRTRANLRAIIILRQSDPDIKFEVFQRLNSGGVRLNAQEIRNSAYPGILNDKIMALSTNEMFHRMLGITPRTQNGSAIYLEMRDAEFVLRFFTYRTNWKTYSGGIQRGMDEFMVKHRNAVATAIEGMAADFLETLEAVEAFLGEHAFQRWLPEQGKWRNQVLASLFDAEMFAFRGREPAQVHAHREALMDAFLPLFTDLQFRKSIDAATNTPSLFKYRIDCLVSICQRILSD